MPTRLWKSLAVTCLLCLLAACGGDGGESPEPTQTAIGTIDAFGSVVVNGVRFDVSGATVTMDGVVQNPDRLRAGMVVKVQGRIRNDGTGVADSIRYEDCVQGRLSNIDPSKSTADVLGQTVVVDDDTMFVGLDALGIAEFVEVSCLRDLTNNRLLATRIDRLQSFRAEFEVKGTVSNLDLASSTFTIGRLAVNFADIPPGERPAALSNGMTVETAGRTLTREGLTANRLLDRDRVSFADGDGLEITGYVADFVSMASFTVEGQAVNAAHAVIRNGTVVDLRNGVKVEAEGTMMGNVLVAIVLIVKRPSAVHVESGLQAKDASLGTLTLLGRAFKITFDTVLRDRAISAQQPTLITLDALNAGDRLEVNAHADAAGHLVATRVERTASDPQVVVRGPVVAKIPTTQLTLGGFLVSTGDDTAYFYRDAGQLTVAPATFYDKLTLPPAEPTVVNARGVVGSLSTNVLDATRRQSVVGDLRIGSP